MQEKIVIIGTSVSAMAISKALSKAKMEHIMVGPPFNPSLKLGESMNPEGSTELMNLFPEYKEYFHDKPFTTISVGRYKVECDFSGLRSQNIINMFLNLLSPGIYIPKEMIHVDRLGFDQKLYEDIRKSKYLTIINKKVESLTFCKEKIRVESIDFTDKERIYTKYTFDCTNHARFLGRNLDIPINFISPKQRVVFCHFHSKEAISERTYSWEGGTNLLRVEKFKDEIEGFAWCIPIGKYVSVGISIEDNDVNSKLTKSQIIDSVIMAYSKRGLNLMEKFPNQSEILENRGQYFKHKKAYGDNWCLVGGSYGQIWYMSGSGLGTALTCSAMAVDLVLRPLKAGKAYQKYMDEFIKTHWPVDWFVTIDPQKANVEKFRKNVRTWLSTNLNRLTIYPITRLRTLKSVLAFFSNLFLKVPNIINYLFRLEKFCVTEEVVDGEAVWDDKKLSSMEIKKNVVIELTEVISGKLPISYADKILVPFVTLKMDGFTVRGRLFWKAWVLYLRDYAEEKKLLLKLEKSKLNQNVFSLKASWFEEGRDGKNSNSKKFLQDVLGEMEVKNGKIVYIQTYKKNYTSILGSDFNSNKVFFKFILMIFIWSIKNKKSVLG